MPDISKCRNKDCPLAKTCYRFMCEPNSYQSYANFMPTVDEVTKEVKCNYFMEIWK